MTLQPEQEEPLLPLITHQKQKQRRNLNSHLQKFLCKVCGKKVKSPVYIYNKKANQYSNKSVVHSCRDCYMSTKLEEGKEGGV